MVLEGDFLGGLLCAVCDREIDVGQLYAERLSGMVGSTPAVVLTCVYCDIPDDQS